MSEDLSGRHVLNTYDITVKLWDRWYTSSCIGSCDLIAVT